MDFLENILAVHLVQDIFEGCDIVVVTHDVYPVIHGDVTHAIPGEEILDQLPGQQVVPA